MSLPTGVYGNVGHHTLHKEENNRRRNTAMKYDTKEDKLLIYCPLCVHNL